MTMEKQDKDVKPTLIMAAVGYTMLGVVILDAIRKKVTRGR